ncbi:hypothetical protein [Luteibacter sp. Lutesp34]|uniref:hypothetical protein n=1 Tax=Luteibacter sp. Lutesp34 TaxID=3243030 RepID=UPI0039B62512
MSDLQPPSSPLSDDDVRWLMVRTARSLARLWARLEHFSVQPGRHPMHPSCARDIAPPEPWLEAVAPNTSLSGVVRAVLLAQSLLVDAAVSPEPPDRRRFCLIVQHVSCGALAWSAFALRVAAKLGITLAATPFAETHGASLNREICRLDGTFGPTSLARATPQPRYHAH